MRCSACSVFGLFVQNELFGLFDVRTAHRSKLPSNSLWWTCSEFLYKWAVRMIVFLEILKSLQVHNWISLVSILINMVVLQLRELKKLNLWTPVSTLCSSTVFKTSWTSCWVTKHLHSLYKKSTRDFWIRNSEFQIQYFEEICRHKKFLHKKERPKLSQFHPFAIYYSLK